MDTTKATPELVAALAEAQGEIENASKNAANPHFRSKYADLAEVLNTVRPVLSKHGLSLVQSTGFNGELVTVSTVLGHKSGCLIFSEAACKPAKSDAQGVGAATTYLRRYARAAMTGVAQEDDDGQAARHDGKPQAVQTPAISEAQEAELRDALEAAGKTAEGCCSYFGIEKLSQLPAPRFKEAMEMLKKKAA
jgi:hypothetical protein